MNRITMFIKKHQIIIFFMLTLLIGWMPWYTGKGRFIMAAPMIAAVIVVLLSEGFKGFKELLKRLFKVKANWKWYFFVLLSPVIIYALAISIHVLLGGSLPQFPLIKDNQYMIIMAFLLFLIPWQSSAFFEEIGFRGYALEKLQNRFGPLLGTLILGVFFGAWLLPEFYRNDSFQFLMGGLNYYPWFVLTEVGWSLIMTYVYNKTKKSAFIAGYLFHTAFNTWTLVLLTDVIPGGEMKSLDTRLFIITGIAVALVGLTFTVATKGKLGFVKQEIVQDN